MKKFIPFLAIPLFLFGSCLKSDKTCNYPDSKVIAPPEQQKALLDSLSVHYINATLSPFGFYYKIVKPGTGASVSNLCSEITANYTGGFFNGTHFDSTTTSVKFTLGKLIVAWQKAIPLVREGGELLLYVPPSLGYGPKNTSDNQGNIIIPANSYLVFSIKVISIE